MKANSIILFLLIALSFFECGEDGYGSYDNDDQPNRNPGSFEVTISDITTTSATLNWTMAIDEDGDKITYDVEIAISPVELANSPTVTSQTSVQLKLANLRANQSYYGRVIAMDSKGGHSSTSFNFTTNK